MKKRRFLIPLVVFIVCSAIAFSIIVIRRIAVRQMFNDAGRDGRPIVYVRYRDKHYVDLIHLLTIDYGPVKLFSESLHLDWWSYPFFSENGSLHILTHPRNNELPGHWLITFPEIHASQLDNWESDLISKDINMEFIIYGSSDRYIVWAGLDDFQIFDLVTGDHTDFEFESERPWPPPHNRQANSEDYEISPDGSVIVTREHQSTNRWAIWRYDILDGTWSQVAENLSGYRLSIGPEGKVIGLGNSRTSTTGIIFVDGFTGETIHTVQDSTKSIIGKRWIVCEPTSGFSDLIFIDMEDDWKEYRITLPTDDLNGMAVYFPPPGGIEEMLRMREEVGE